MPGLAPAGRGGLRAHLPIPPAWSPAHRPVTAATMTTLVEVHRADDDPTNDDDGWSPDTGPSTPAADPLVWTGHIRLTPAASAVLSADAAAEDVSSRPYTAWFPHGCPELRAGRDGDTVLVLTNPDDPGAVGRWLRVADTATGSRVWSAQHTLTDDLTANNPGREPAPAPDPLDAGGVGP